MAYLGRGPGFTLFLDQTEAQRAEKFLGETAPHPPPYLRVWMTGPPIISRSGSGTENCKTKLAIETALHVSISYYHERTTLIKEE